MITNLKMRLALASASLAVAVACGGGGDKTATPPAADAKAAGSSSVVADGDFGVPECDQYMRKYVACIESKVPEMARAAMKQGLDQTKSAWKQAASTPQGRTGLAQACTQAEAAAKSATAAYGCQW